MYKTIHAGFDPAAADADPNVVAPVDALKVLEKRRCFWKPASVFLYNCGDWYDTGGGAENGKRNPAVSDGRPRRRCNYGFYMRHLYSLRRNDGKRNRKRRTSDCTDV